MANVTKQASTRFSIVKRSRGQSAVEKASYISRSVLVSEYDGQTYRPKYHEDLVHSEITLSPNAPKEYADRATLWNAVELSEKGQKSQLARMLKASLPNDWSYELAECGLLEEYGGKVLSKMVEKVYIYGDGNLEVMFRNEDYYRMVAVEVKRWQSIILGHLLYQSHLNLEIKII